ncbi:MAG: HD domain-containing phosphohydrolase [Candidatus Omnitrophota bacterium]
MMIWFMNIIFSNVCLIITCCFGIIIGYLFSVRKKYLIKKIEDITHSATNIPIQGLEKNGTIFLWNRASEIVYGYLRKDAIGKKITDLLLAESEKQEFLTNIKLVCDTHNTIAPRQWEMISKNGQKYTMYSTMFPYKQSGRCSKIFCIDVDVSDLKNREKEIEYSKENYQAIFNGIDEAVYVVDPHDNRIIDVNQKGMEQIGYTKEELSKVSLLDLSYGDKDVIFEKTKVFTAKAFYEGSQKFEWLSLSKQGRIFETEVILKREIINERDCILATVRDISSRKRIEENLRASEKKYQDLLKNSRSLIFSLDKEGIITSVNSAAKRILKFQKSEILGKNFVEFLVESEKEKAKSIFKDILNDSQCRDEELVCLNKNKKEVIVLLTAWAQLNKDTEIIGVNGIVTDITQQRIILERMKKMVMQIVSMLSETISVVDQYTEKHCKRLQDLSVEIGKKLGLDKQRIEYLKFASLLHDIGKVGVPINILLKKGKLDDDEREKIKEHPQKGADVIRQLSGFEEIATIIQQHQERIDGKGYPQGLKKEEIKKEAMIISVVDAYDAMTSNRPYRKAMSKRAAIKELKANSGSQFDPEIVDLFIEIINSTLENNS